MVAPGEPKGQPLHTTLPELGGVQFGWAMCTNPACINFGIFYGGPEDSDRDNRNSPKPAIKRKWCDMPIPLARQGSIKPRNQMPTVNNSPKPGDQYQTQVVR